MSEKVKTILGKVGFSPKGVYSAETTYQRLDVVSYEGSSFVVLKDGLQGATPVNDNENYMQIAAKGDKGDAFKYSDFTEEQLALLKGAKGDPFEYEDFSPEQIEDLKRPATEAAEKATEAATEAKNLPKIQNGTWWVYDIAQKKYVDSGSPATGKSPKIQSGTWWTYNDETGDYFDTGQSVNAEYQLTKEKVEGVLIGEITSHNHASQLAAALVNYVQKVAGKDLSTNDFTDDLKQKLEGLQNYDDEAIRAAVQAVQQRIDTLVGTSASEAIDTFNEIEAFLAGITDKETLTGLLNDLKTEIQESIPTKLSQLQNDNHTVQDASYVHTDNNYTNEEKTKLSKLNLVPTLDHEPTEDDLTFMDSEGAHNFQIGNMARVADEDSETGYSFYQLYDITGEGKAVWGKAGSGSGEPSGETLLLTLKSNQGNPDSALNGAQVHVKYGDNDVTLTWQGESLSTQIPVNMTYQIEYPTVEGYKTPDNGEYIALTGNTRQVEVTYQAELVTVTVGTDDSGNANGQKVTINGGQHDYSGSPVSVKIPFGTHYAVSVDAKSGYTTPAQQEFDASQATRAVTMTYEAIKVNVIHINQTVADPNTMVSGDVNGEVIQWIRQNSHRVLAKKTSNGHVTYCRLKDDDGTKYYDGSAAQLNGNEGDVFLKLPEFYYKGTEGNTVDLSFAKEKIDDSYVKWDGNTLIGVYEAYATGNKAYSRSGVDSTGSVSQANWKSYARARGTGYQLVDWQMHCVLGCLYYAQYGNTNCQKEIGVGTNDYQKQTGQTNSLGMTDTKASTNGNSQSINFWGLENWWGNKYEWIDDYDNPANQLTAKVNDPVNGGTRELAIYNYTGYYPKKMKFGKYLDLVATSDDPKNGSDSTGYCDYQWWPGSTNSSPRVLRRSCYYSDTDGGVAYAYAYYASSGTYSSYGSRLAFRGVAREAESVGAFKALPVL